jgi:type II secretory ATPase GspE/PulE/Tfp pilus assembly ATPase PilB-like protein
VVAAADPSKYEPLDDLGVVFGMSVQPVIVPFDVIDRVIVRTNGRRVAAGLIINLEEQQFEPAVSQLERIPLGLLSAATPPVIRLITALLWRAVNDQARGIQVESLEQELLVRFRTNEALYDVMSAPKCYERALVSRLKEMTGLSVADGQCPQTGHIRLRIAGRVVAARISTMLGAFGEGIVLRLPDSEHELVDVIENCVDAPSRLAADTTGPPSC